jgi:hypothetical protein
MRRGVMARKISRLTAALALLAMSAFSQAVARPLVPAERRYEPFDSVLPACDDSAPLNEILARFQEREGEFWRTGLEIAAFAEIREIGFRSNGLDYIPRRYCVARVILNDSNVRSVSYSISKDLGGIGDTFGIEWCVAGLDRNDAFAPNCKMARP